MKKRLRKLVALVAAAVAASLCAPPAAAYRIMLDQVHETMTRAAVDCLARAQGAAPANCALDRDQLKALSRRNHSDFWRAVRWPDDPLRQTSIIAGVQNINYVVDGGCAHLLERYSRNLQRAGLACRSHWGDLQFFHAQRSSQSETMDVTRAKILDWARFAYRVANGEISPSANFCEQFAGTSHFSRAMVPPRFPYCSRRRSAWTVGEFFTFRCPWTPRQCNTDPTTELMRRSATGAILHVIQDSYSQSHVLRTDMPRRNDEGVPLAVMECGAPREYTHYNRETAETHGTADDWPRLGSTCGPGSARDDAITASATALYYLQEERTADQFVEYLTARVF